MLEHGIETGIIRRLPHGEFIEVHQPLAGVDEHGHAIPLAYQGAPVPKRMNQLGFGGTPVPGSLLTPDPPERDRGAGAAPGARRPRPRPASTRATRRSSTREARGSSARTLAGRPDAGRPKDITD